MIVNHAFWLDEERIRRFEKAGIHSIRDLAKTLDALDLVAKIQLEEVKVAKKGHGATSDPGASD